MAAILKFKFEAEDDLEKMAPMVFELSTPKLTKLSNKINFGTPISRNYIMNLTKWQNNDC